MEISFRNQKLAKEFNTRELLQRNRGEQQARLIARRLAALRAAINLGDFVPMRKPERCHELTGNRQGQLSMDLDGPYRLIFKPTHNPLPQRPGGGLDWQQVTAITILAVEDTHE